MIQVKTTQSTVFRSIHCTYVSAAAFVWSGIVHYAARRTPGLNFIKLCSARRRGMIILINEIRNTSNMCVRIAISAQCIFQRVRFMPVDHRITTNGQNMTCVVTNRISSYKTN